ncbi:universal stress protein [Providencia stuartii]|uniref:universal stress protein n=1 Tax=Providencia stuartii TaxID=588 RepID=UPI003D7F8DCD
MTIQQTILIPIDIHDNFSPHLLEHHLQAFAGNGTRACFITVIPDDSMLNRFALGFYTPGEIEEDKHRHEKAYQLLTQYVQSITLPEMVVECEVLFGHPRERILEKAQQEKASLIMLHSRSPNLSTLLLGSTASAVVKYATTSVLIMRERLP